jgi:hypothetical protein
VKCKTVREIRADVNCFPGYVSLNELGREVIKTGTVICRDEFPLADCVTLVLNGLATPEDEECRKACNRTDAEIAAAKAAMDKMLNPPVEESDEDESDDFEEDE